MSSSAESPHGRREVSRDQSIVSIAILALLPVFACFLGGATEKWEEGIVLVVLGAYLVINPPQLSLGLIFNLSLIALVGFAAVTFLPHHLFYIPAWRSALTDDLSISIADSVTPQPWITAGALVNLIAGVCWFYQAATIDLDLKAVRLVIRIFVSAVVLLAIVSIVLYSGHSGFPFWINERGFGPFPNRNQTADLFGISGVVLLACVQEDIRSGKIRWVFGIMGLCILLTALILNFSRAGIAIFVGASFLWAIAVALRKRSVAGLALGISILLILITAVLLFGGRTAERFQQWGASGPGISSDFRWRIFQDTFRLLQNSPWCGIGLGNFRPIFAMFRKESVGELTVLHPESDWLWLWSEAGWPALACVLLGALFLLRRVLPLQEGTNQRFRMAVLIAALMFAAHGFVDVSAHRVGTCYTGLFLLGLALYRPLQLKRSVSISIVFRSLGVVLLLIGAGWAVSGGMKALVPGGAGVAAAKRLATPAYQAHDFPETVALTSRALDWAPLDWELYFRRALAEVGADQPANALTDFRRARFLEPVALELPR